MVYPAVKDPVSVPNGTPNGTLFVCVDETYGRKLCDPRTENRVSLEDCARGYWMEANIAAAHGYNCDWLMARLHGKIVEVWRIDKGQGTHGWMDSSVTPKVTNPSDRPKSSPRKLGCVLIPVNIERRRSFLNQRIHLGRNLNPLRGYFI